jgi:hypothetical protein
MTSLNEATLDMIDELERERQELVAQHAEMLDRLKRRRCTPARVWHSDAQQMRSSATHLGLEIRRIDDKIAALLDGEVD